MSGRLRLLLLLALSIPATGFLCLPVLPFPASPYTGPAPAGLFTPSVSVDVSPTTTGANGTVTFTMDVPAGHLLPAGAAIIVPAEWGVASDSGVTDGDVVGNITGTFTASDEFVSTDGSCSTEVDFQTDLSDATTDTGDAAYPAFLNFLAPGQHKARYFGSDEVAGVTDVSVNVLVDAVSGGRDRIVIIAGDPTSAPAFQPDLMCSPWSFTLTLNGTSSPSGQPVLTNPAQSGAYTFTAILASEWDQDGDARSNALDNCPIDQPNDQTDIDLDRLGALCDPDDLVEHLDLDGDDIPNGVDNCPFAANAGQADGDLDDLGDACDPNPDADGTRYVLDCEQDVFIGTAGTDTATCAGLESVGGVARQPQVRGAPASTADGESAVPSAVVGTLVAAVVALSVIAAAGYVAWRRR